jgi:hypothetical protein
MSQTVQDWVRVRPTQVVHLGFGEGLTDGLGLGLSQTGLTDGLGLGLGLGLAGGIGAGLGITGLGLGLGEGLGDGQPVLHKQ